MTEKSNVEKHQSNLGNFSGKYEKLSKKKENDVKWSEMMKSANVNENSRNKTIFSFFTGKEGKLYGMVKHNEKN
jgi:hypothetical protein